MTAPDILQEIKRRVAAVDPTAQVVLYGSYARGEQGPDSDIDLLILIDREKVSHADEQRLTYPLFDIEFDTGTMISPRVMPRNWWVKPPLVTPFYENVQREGRML